MSSILPAILLVITLLTAPGARSASVRIGGPDPVKNDPLSRFVGSAAEGVGDTLFLKADEYYHGGIEDEHHEDKTEDDLLRGGHLDEGRTHNEEPTGWIDRLRHGIEVHDLRHLEKEERAEMLPFFAAAAALDPHNVEAILTASYWLERQFGKTEEAGALLEKAVRDNSQDWQVWNALARYRERRQASAADLEALYAKADALAGEVSGPDRAELLFRLAEARVKLGRKEDAIRDLEKALDRSDASVTDFFRGKISDRIKELRAE